MTDQNCSICQEPAIYICECNYSIYLCEKDTLTHISKADSFQSHPIKNIHLDHNSKKTEAEEDEEILKSIGLDFKPHKTPINCIVAMGQAIYIAENGQLIKFNLITNLRDWKSDSTSQIWSVAASRDLELVVMALDNGDIIFVKSENGEWMDTRQPIDKSATGVIFSADSSMLLAISSGGTFTVYNSEDLGTHMSKSVANTSFISVSIDPTNKFGFSGAADGKVVMWDIDAKTKVEELKFHSNAVSALACDKQTLYSASFDGIIGIWDFKQKRLRRQLSNYKFKIFSMTLNSKGTLLYYTDNKRFLRCYDIMNQKPAQKTYTGNELITGLTLNEENEEIFAISGERTIKKFGLQDLALKGSVGNLNLVIATVTNDKYYLVCAFRDGWIKFVSLINGNIEYDFHYLDGKKVLDRYPELGLSIEEEPEVENQ